ncbi:MAG: hypothetical protein ACI31S_00440 [Bacilli bacterium]
MKKIATKIITIFSQVGIVSLFLVLLFSNTKGNDEVITISNNNFNKMADSVSFLFKREEQMLDTSSDVITPLDDSSSNTDDSKVTDENTKKEENKKEEVISNVEGKNASDNRVSLDYDVIETYIGSLTGYGPDCYKCSGKTKSGYNLNESIYYDDDEFGTVRILAGDPSFGKNAIFRVSNVPGMDSFIAIVLDTGSNVGFDRGTLFDLAFATEKDPNIIGLTQNVKFELLRRGESW